ncbi:MAG: glycosyl transferase [Oscillospiraceae bacterium]|nr:glycosyl transferase [Oscillospiraceae bacterium]
MIPKVIHYCWFGRSPLPPLAVRCIESWKKYCPDYEIRQWNEENFDVNCSTYTREAYEAEKWAFVSDVARLWALVEHGGVYMDTDCELVKPIDAFLSHQAFSGFESAEYIPTAIMACERNFDLFREFFEYYDGRRFVKDDGSFDMTANVSAMTEIISDYGLIKNNQFQIIKGFALYPTEYFCPQRKELGVFDFGKNNYAIHHFAGSWGSEYEKKRNARRFRLERVLGKKLGQKLYNALEVYRAAGIYGMLRKIRGNEWRI